MRLRMLSFVMVLFVTAHAQTNHIEKRIDELLKNKNTSFYIANKQQAPAKKLKLNQLPVKIVTGEKMPGMEKYQLHYSKPAIIPYIDPYANMQFTFKADTPARPSVKKLQHFNLYSDAWNDEYFVVSFNNTSNKVVSIAYRGEQGQTLQYDFDDETGEMNNYSTKVTSATGTDNKQYIFAILDMKGKEGSDEMLSLERGQSLQRITSALWNENSACKDRAFNYHVNDKALMAATDSLMRYIEKNPEIITVVDKPVYDYFNNNIVQVKCTIEKQADYVFRYSSFEGYKTTRGRVANTLLNKSMEDIIIKNISTNEPTNHCLDVFVTMEVVVVIENAKCVAVVW